MTATFLSSGAFSPVRGVRSPHGSSLVDDSNFRLADIVTLGNGFCGAMSILSSMRYLLTSERTQLYWALVYPALGFVFDAFDGKVARWRNESSMLGQELDSLADSVRPAERSHALGN